MIASLALVVILCSGQRIAAIRVTPLNATKVMVETADEYLAFHLDEIAAIEDDGCEAQP